MLWEFYLLDALIISAPILLDHKGMSLNGDRLAESVILRFGFRVFRDESLRFLLEIWRRSDRHLSYKIEVEGTILGSWLDGRCILLY